MTKSKVKKIIKQLSKNGLSQLEYAIIDIKYLCNQEDISFEDLYEIICCK